jgi:hypothetical protein
MGTTADRPRANIERALRGHRWRAPAQRDRAVSGLVPLPGTMSIADRAPGCRPKPAGDDRLRADRSSSRSPERRRRATAALLDRGLLFSTPSKGEAPDLTAGGWGALVPASSGSLCALWGRAKASLLRRLGNRTLKVSNMLPTSRGALPHHAPAKLATNRDGLCVPTHCASIAQ